MELLVSGWSPLVAKFVLTLWFSSENQSEIAVLSQLNHVLVVKHNKQFNSDSQRLVLSLRVELSVYGAVFLVQCLRCSHVNWALGGGQESSLFSSS
ncbi:hypothetical protein [Vibrio parahaemolyticus]|uniref:hypothetical protein n=1 Tax=Vibrio parahaemolyticus TaxID=670 RepID=UPI00263CC7CD|nr:hypothetical protein [Vibrio parahaemolyticus]MDN4734734.1 hypothetical protein [Vibrio parahaemolyticus]MDS1997848.1 hypothetical protein [Vibrio parahaemolyticus]